MLLHDFSKHLAFAASMTLIAFSGRSEAAQTSVKTFLCPAQRIVLQVVGEDGAGEPAKFRCELNLEPERSASNHTGGANFVLADGSVRFLRASIDLALFDRQGALVEIRGQFRGQREGAIWSFYILPHLEQKNLYRFVVAGDSRTFEFDVFGFLLPAVQARLE